MKTYILGMAKSPLQVKKGQYNGIADEFAKPLKPGSARSLELDFLRLVYAKKELSSKGQEVHAYLMVTTEEVVNAVKNWMVKYDAEGIVNIQAAFSEDDTEHIEKLIAEKKQNQLGNVFKEKNNKAKADIGKDLVEERLKSLIENKHGKGDVIKDVKEMPFRINWDYCWVE
jgi:hypothetical protein